VARHGGGSAPFYHIGRAAAGDAALPRARAARYAASVDVPERAPRTLSVTADRDLARAHGFLILFGWIWAGVGGAMVVVFGFLALVIPPLGLGALISAPFLVAGGLLVEWGHRRARRDRALLEHGRLAAGEVVENVVDRRFRKNRRYSTRITARGVDPATGREYRAVLRTWDDEIIARHPVGTAVPIVFDPESGRAVAPSVLGVSFEDG
jgi:hypothetical protein